MGSKGPNVTSGRPLVSMGMPGRARAMGTVGLVGTDRTPRAGGRRDGGKVEDGRWPKG